MPTHPDRCPAHPGAAPLSQQSVLRDQRQQGEDECGAKEGGTSMVCKAHGCRWRSAKEQRRSPFAGPPLSLRGLCVGCMELGLASVFGRTPWKPLVSLPEEPMASPDRTEVARTQAPCWLLDELLDAEVLSGCMAQPIPSQPGNARAGSPLFGRGLLVVAESELLAAHEGCPQQRSPAYLHAGRWGFPVSP